MMRNPCNRSIQAGVLAALFHAGAALAQVSLLGVGAIPSDARDQSGLGELLEDGVTPGNRVGGLGSAIDYSGTGTEYLAVSDRGPAAGRTHYAERLYTLDILLKRKDKDHYEVLPRIKQTRLLRDGLGQPFTGWAAEFDASHSGKDLRFDAEGLRVGACGKTVYISDEYGPAVHEFERGSGRWKRTIPVPEKFAVYTASADPAVEMNVNLAGRQSNQGMEGLALSPDGRRLYGIMQGPLLQDGAIGADHRRAGTNLRLIEIDLPTGAVRELLYPLEDKGNGVNELLAVDAGRFLILERDGKSGAEAAFKKIYQVDIAGATDISDIPLLPRAGIPQGVTPVRKQLFLDLLDSRFGLAGPSFPEKIEGLTFGPSLEDGRHVLIMSVDNDFEPRQPTLFYAFAIDSSDLPVQRPRNRQAAASCRQI